MLRLEALTTADQFDPKSFHDFGVHFGNRSHEANWPGALSLLETESWPDLIRNAVSACSKAKQWSQALLLFEEATELRVVDLATYTSAIFACKQANLWQHGISLLCNLRKQELQADAMTLAAAAGACERGLQWQQALALLSTARDAQRESALISNTVMNAMANSQQWPQALLLLAETHKRRLQSFLITRNAVVAACSRSSEWLSAVQLLQNFQRERLQVDVFTYNNALSACVKSHKWQQTLQLFQDLRQQRLDEAVMPYEFAVSACGKGDQWQLGLELTNSMLERKFEVHPITRSVAIGMCQQCGADVSELVLRLLDDSDNVMLNGKALNVLAKSSWQRGLQLLQSMVRRKVADKISYVSMMSVFETTGNWRQALQLLQDVRQEGVEVDPLLFSVAINACENAQQWPFALALLKEGGGDLHSHSFTYVASLQALGNQMQWEQVLMFLEEVEDRFAADVKVQSAAVNACALGSWEAAWCLLQGMQAKHLPTQYATSALMKSAAQATEWALALHLFHSTDTMDLVGFNSALGACQVAHLWEEALGLLQKMQDSELQADQVSYSSAISTCGKALHWQHALQLMTAVPAESAVFNAVINAFGRSSEWRRALLVFDKIPKVDLISYNSLINACAKGTERDVALQLFRQLPSAHLAPDLFTFGALMTAINDGNQALALLRELEDFPSLKANVVTYTAAMAACGRGRQWSEALELFGEMKDSGISPSVISFNTAMEACDDHWQHSLALLRDMRNPNSFSYSASMSCCALANAWPVALQLLQEADERDFEAEEMLVLRNLLIGACGEEWTVALDLVDNFYHRQVATSIVTYTTLMDITRKAWQWEYTVHIFNDLRRRQVEADGRACSSVIMTIANAKQWPSAFALMEQLEERRVEVDYSTGYQVVLDAYMSSIS